MRHTNKEFKCSKSKIKKRNLLIFGLACLVWFIFRTGTKPSRFQYPCQKAALANSSILLSFSIPIAFSSFWLKGKKFVAKRGLIFTFIILLLSVILNSEQFFGSIQPIGAVGPEEIDLNLESRFATEFPSSDIFVVNGREYVHISELVDLMGLHGLDFYNSDTIGLNRGPEGLIAVDDFVLIKVNSQWDERGGTNTDLLKELIQMIVDHPDGFVGEILVADNGQDQYGPSGNGGSLDWVNNNAEDHSQSVQDVVDMFAVSYDVSTFLWDTITLNSVGEYSEGDLSDGYVINQTANSATGIKVSYPKFQTKFGTYVSFKMGIWNPVAEVYNNEGVKVINFPVLKSHSGYGVTASVKHYMGVVSAKQTNAHAKVATGGMGTEMVETRFPTLNILDAIWVNANPGSSFSCGPSTPYSEATRVNTIMASIDPCALDYWGSKYVLMQTAKSIGYSDTHTLDPDNTNPSGSWGEAFGVWLELARNEISTAGYSVTTDESRMNVYLKSAVSGPEIGIPFQVPSRDNVWPGEDVHVSVSVTDTESGVKNVTLFFAINDETAWEDQIMDYNSSTGLFEATIPGHADETWVRFKIVAYNNQGYEATRNGDNLSCTYQVIPEFSSVYLMLIFFVILALVVTISKRKR